MTSTNTYDPETHAIQLGIRIIDACLPAGTLALWDETTRTILASPGLLHRQRRCVIAHELAHAVNGDTHAPIDDVAARKRERRADLTAAGWLLDSAAVRTALAVSPDSLSAAAADLDVTPRILSAWLEGRKGDERW